MPLSAGVEGKHMVPSDRPASKRDRVLARGFTQIAKLRKGAVTVGMALVLEFYTGNGEYRL